MSDAPLITIEDLPTLAVATIIGNDAGGNTGKQAVSELVDGALTAKSVSTSGLATVLGVDDDGDVKAFWSPRQRGQFDVLDYVKNVDVVSAEAIEAGDIDAQDGDHVLAAVHAAGDDAMAYTKATARGGAIIRLPVGVVGMKDEFFSDDFQESWWDQTDLGKGKHIQVIGPGRDVSRVQIRSDYISAVRNTANGNQRDYGPWADQPSPSILFPMIASAAGGGPAAFSRRGFLMFGTRIIGKDPIAEYLHNELDAFTSDMHAVWFSNHGQVINGSYNSKHRDEHFETCGLQPVEGGAIMGYPPGWPPSYVRFDISTSGSTVTVVAKAISATDGYAIGDEVPFFNTSYVGKEFIIQGAAQWSGFVRTTRLTIATVGSDGVSTATMTLPGGVTGTASASLLPGSFCPVKATTSAGSETITLSDAVLFGSADDMVGHLISIAKAGSTELSANDMFSSRIAAVGSGDDTDGYTSLTLIDPARDAVTDWFMPGIGHNTVYEETIARESTSALGFNDTDFTDCRWEFSHSSNQSGAPQFVISDSSGAVNYLACKIHGSNPTGGNFASDIQVILDNIRKMSFLGTTFTHSAMQSNGHIRMMGAQMREVHFTDVELGTWTQPGDVPMMYLDPQTGYNVNNWSPAVIGPPRIFDTNFPFGAQEFVAGNSLSRAVCHKILKSRGTRNRVLLTSADDLDDFLIEGAFYWENSVPTNAPSSGNYSRMNVLADPAGNRVAQWAADVDSKAVWVRYYVIGVGFTPWIEQGVFPVATSTTLLDATSAENTTLKRNGKVYRNSTDAKLWVATGSVAASPYWTYARSSVETPS